MTYHSFEIKYEDLWKNGVPIGVGKMIHEEFTLEGNFE